MKAILYQSPVLLPSGPEDGNHLSVLYDQGFEKSHYDDFFVFMRLMKPSEKIVLGSHLHLLLQGIARVHMPGIEAHISISRGFYIHLEITLESAVLLGNMSGEMILAFDDVLEYLPEGLTWMGNFQSSSWVYFWKRFLELKLAQCMKETFPQACA